MKKVYINSGDEISEIAITVNNELESFYRLKDGFLTGAVFSGKVRSVKKQIGIFVDIGKEKDGLLNYRDGLKPGDYVMVQVLKEPTETKGCSLTEKITLPGRYLVLNDTGEIKYSRKLTETAKGKLTGLFEPSLNGFVFRSSCETASISDIKSEAEYLRAKYAGILKKFNNLNRIECIYADKAEDVALRFADKRENVIYGFDDNIKEQIKNIGERKVVKDGVELVFDKTEAMTVVDVNMHRYSKSFGDTETASFHANTVAVKELAKQIRLRNIGGIIMVDFISMAKRENTEKLLEIIKEELKKDSVRVNVELIESIGMFALVRKIRYGSV